MAMAKDPPRRPGPKMAMRLKSNALVPVLEDDEVAPDTELRFIFQQSTAP